MPRIILDGCDTEKIIQQIIIDVKVDFRKDFFIEHRERADQKLKEIEKEIGEVLKKYFDDYGSERMSNHQYNLMMNPNE